MVSLIDNGTGWQGIKNPSYLLSVNVSDGSQLMLLSNVFQPV